MKHNGFIISNGYSVLTLGNNVTVNSDSWDRGLLLADSHDHPQLIWSGNPSMSPINYYKIYRKLDTGSWLQVDTTSHNTWTDNSLTYENGEGQQTAHVYYYVKSVNSSSTSDPSNTVDAFVGKSRGKVIPPVSGRLHIILSRIIQIHLIQ